MRCDVEKPLESRMLGNLHVRFGVGAGVQLPGPHHPEHAENPEWELGDSRISKLWLQRLDDKRTVFNWDRGMDQPAASDLVQAIVDFLAAGLADHVYAE